MEQNIQKAVKLYSGDKPIELFVDKLEYNLNKLNAIFDDIKELFTRSGIPNFEKLPDDRSERGKFASLFKSFNGYLEAAKNKALNGVSQRTHSAMAVASQKLKST